MTEIAKDSAEKHEGSTRAKGSYSIEQDGDNVKVNLYLSVRKSGISGTGHGAIGFALLGNDGGTIFQASHGLTVGADISGAKEKEYKETFTLLNDKWKQVIGCAFSINGTTDRIGTPTDISGWEKLIGEQIGPILGGLGVGEAKEVADWIFKKIPQTVLAG